MVPYLGPRKSQQGQSCGRDVAMRLVLSMLKGGFLPLAQVRDHSLPAVAEPRLLCTAGCAASLPVRSARVLNQAAQSVLDHTLDGLEHLEGVGQVLLLEGEREGRVEACHASDRRLQVQEAGVLDGGSHLRAKAAR